MLVAAVANGTNKKEHDIRLVLALYVALFVFSISVYNLYFPSKPRISTDYLMYSVLDRTEIRSFTKV